MYFLSERTIFIYQTFYSLKMYLFCAGINASHPFFFFLIRSCYLEMNKIPDVFFNVLYNFLMNTINDLM